MTDFANASVADTWKHEVIYQVLIDRFAGYDPEKDPMWPDFIGGTLRGVTKNLPYMHELGATCVYLSPFYRGVAYHGYHPTDLTDIDSHFGKEEDLQELIDKAHHLGMKVMVDFVPNHFSYYHPFFISAQTDRYSPYHDWFIFEDWPNTYLSFLHYDVLPKVNLNNPAAREHVIQAAERWVHMGIDSLRLDHVIGPSLGFWEAFVGRLKTVKPDLFLLAEVNLQFMDMRVHGKTLNLPLPWHDIADLSIEQKHTALMAAYGDLFDSYIDFAFQAIIQEFASGQLDRAGVEEKLRHHYGQLPANRAFPAQVDNHDMYRIMYVAGGNIDTVKDAISIQFATGQPKIIYYGTEIGLTHRKPTGLFSENNFDLLVRQPMPPLGQRPLDHPVFEHYRKLTGRA